MRVAALVLAELVVRALSARTGEHLLPTREKADVLLGGPDLLPHDDDPQRATVFVQVVVLADVRHLAFVEIGPRGGVATFCGAGTHEGAPAEARRRHDAAVEVASETLNALRGGSRFGLEHARSMAVTCTRVQSLAFANVAQEGAKSWD